MKSENARSGSLKSFFEWNYLKLRNYTRKQLGNSQGSEDAEDILQDVAVNLFTRFDLDYTVENLAAYIYRSIRNRITDSRRKKKQEVPVARFTDEEGNELFLGIPDGAPIEAIIEGFDEPPPADLEYALSMLSPEERELIIENSLKGRTFAELSKAWGISQGTLLSRKHRALNKLHKILKQQ
jgi:RNA polymerase sigma-70 factor (ECF subfamily)